ncbi:MAG: LysR family transcriptional regulator [Desulfuromonas sp.]|nr:MAG: LysR family transcriptional regulator [Desulfuromonas sp.]
MAITFRQLDIFARVAKTGNVTRASAELLLTQSAVSMALAELERLAGGPLFDRHGRRLQLNERGREILPQVRAVLDQVHGIETFLADSLGEPCGTLHVGASTTIGNYLLPGIIGEFSRSYARATVQLSVMNARQVEEGVRDGDLDLGLSEGIPHLGELEVSDWRPDELVVIVGTEHPWARKKSATLAKLATADWIMREPGSGTREVFEEALKAKGLEAAVTLELGHTEAIKKAVEAGLGIGCLSRMTVQRELDNGWLVEVATPLDLRRRLLILSRTGRQPTLLLQAFLDALQSANQSVKSAK